MGTLDVVNFTVDGVPQGTPSTEVHSGDLNTLDTDSQRICAVFSEMSGGRPIDRHLFQLIVASSVHRGIEHGGHTTRVYPRKGLARPDRGKRSDDEDGLLGFIRHEYVLPDEHSREAHVNQL